MSSGQSSGLSSYAGVHGATPSFIPHYMGEANAFAIQLFCIAEEYESRSLDFLPKAFDLMPFTTKTSVSSCY